MSDKYDEHELVDPASRYDIESPEYIDRKERTWRKVIQQPHQPSRSRRLVLVVAVAVLAIGGIAAGYELTRPVTNPSTVECYGQPHVLSRAVVAPLNGTAVATCRAVWRSGELGSRGGVPLVPCVNAAGTALVFPSRDRDLCAQLGFAKLSTVVGNETQRLAELSRRLSSQGGACISPADARRFAAAELRALGLSSWGVRDQSPFTSTKPCATYYLDTGDHVVELVPRIRP